jgi:hypothetical protein
MKKNKWFSIVILIFVVVILFSYLKFKKEDSWVCRNGVWLKHGNPSEPIPTAKCGLATSTTIGGVVDSYFEQEGVVVKDNPGLPQGDLFMIYEEPGQPGLKVKLIFDEKSMCGDTQKRISCMALSVSDYGLVNGGQIRVRGIIEGENIRVREIYRQEGY